MSIKKQMANTIHEAMLIILDQVTHLIRDEKYTPEQIVKWIKERKKGLKELLK